MRAKLSDHVRRVAKEKYVEPALRDGKREFSIPVRGMLDSLLPAGFPRNHTPQICSSLKTSKFLDENGLEIVRVDGPPSGVSPTVVMHYRMTGPVTVPHTPALEESGERAARLVARLRGLLRDEIAAHGGTEAFVEWIRADATEAV